MRRTGLDHSDIATTLWMRCSFSQGPGPVSWVSWPAFRWMLCSERLGDSPSRQRNLRSHARYRGVTLPKRMTLRLTDQLAGDLEAIARAENVPVAEEARRALAEHIASRRSDAAFQGRLRKSMERHQEILRRLPPISGFRVLRLDSNSQVRSTPQLNNPAGRPVSATSERADRRGEFSSADTEQVPRLGRWGWPGGEIPTSSHRKPPQRPRWPRAGCRSGPTC